MECRHSKVVIDLDKFKFYLVSARFLIEYFIEVQIEKIDWVILKEMKKLSWGIVVKVIIYIYCKVYLSIKL